MCVTCLHVRTFTARRAHALKWDEREPKSIGGGAVQWQRGLWEGAQDRDEALGTTDFIESIHIPFHVGQTEIVDGHPKDIVQRVLLLDARKHQTCAVHKPTGFRV